jgi:hypothetical protein
LSNDEEGDGCSDGGDFGDGGSESSEELVEPAESEGESQCDAGRESDASYDESCDEIEESGGEMAAEESVIEQGADAGMHSPPPANPAIDQDVLERRRQLAGLELQSSEEGADDEETDDDDGDGDDVEFGDVLAELDEDDAFDEGKDPAAANNRISQAAWEYIWECNKEIQAEPINLGKAYKGIRNGNLVFNPPDPATTMQGNLQLGGAHFCRLPLVVWDPRSMVENCLMYVLSRVFAFAFSPAHFALYIGQPPRTVFLCSIQLLLLQVWLIHLFWCGYGSMKCLDAVLAMCS